MNSFWCWWSIAKAAASPDSYRPVWIEQFVARVLGLACSIKVLAVVILRGAWRRILNNKEFIDRISKLQPITPRTGEEFKKFIDNQRPVIKRARELIESFKYVE